MLWLKGNLQELAAASFEEDCCVICKLGFENDKATIYSVRKGYSVKKLDVQIHAHLTECINNTPKFWYIITAVETLITNRRRPTCFSTIEDDQLPQAKRLRSSMLS